jgi:hypothetical protein
LYGEDHNSPQLWQNPVALGFLCEEAGQTFRRHLRLDRVWVEPFSGTGDGVRIDIGGEDLELDIALHRGDLLAEEYS